jgi:hypothetical protein
MIAPPAARIARKSDLLLVRDASGALIFQPPWDLNFSKK